MCHTILSSSTATPEKKENEFNNMRAVLELILETFRKSGMDSFLEEDTHHQNLDIYSSKLSNFSSAKPIIPYLFLLLIHQPRGSVVFFHHGDASWYDSHLRRSYIR